MSRIIIMGERRTEPWGDWQCLGFDLGLRVWDCGFGTAGLGLRDRDCGSGIAELELRERDCGSGIAELDADGRASVGLRRLSAGT